MARGGFEYDSWDGLSPRGQAAEQRDLKNAKKVPGTSPSDRTNFKTNPRRRRESERGHRRDDFSSGRKELNAEHLNDFVKTFAEYTESVIAMSNLKFSRNSVKTRTDTRQGRNDRWHKHSQPFASLAEEQKRRTENTVSTLESFDSEIKKNQESQEKTVRRLFSSIVENNAPSSQQSIRKLDDNRELPSIKEDLRGLRTMINETKQDLKNSSENSKRDFHDLADDLAANTVSKNTMLEYESNIAHLTVNLRGVENLVKQYESGFSQLSQVQDFVGKLEGVLHEFGRPKESNKDLWARVDHQSSQLDQYNAQLDSFKSQLDSKTIQFDRLKCELDEQKSKLDQQNDQQRSQVDEHKSHFDQQKSVLDQQKSQLDQQDGRLDQQTCRLDQLKSQLGQQHSQLDQLDDRFKLESNRLLAQTHEQQIRYDALKEDLDIQMKNYLLLKTEVIGDPEKEGRGLIDIMSEHHEKIEKLDRGILDLDPEKIEKLHEILSEHHEKIEKLDQGMSDLDHEHVFLTNHLSTLKDKTPEIPITARPRSNSLETRMQPSRDQHSSPAVNAVQPLDDRTHQADINVRTGERLTRTEERLTHMDNKLGSLMQHQEEGDGLVFGEFDSLKESLKVHADELKQLREKVPNSQAKFAEEQQEKRFDLISGKCERLTNTFTIHVEEGHMLRNDLSALQARVFKLEHASKNLGLEQNLEKLKVQTDASEVLVESLQQRFDNLTTEHMASAIMHQLQILYPPHPGNTQNELTQIKYRLGQFDHSLPLFSGELAKVTTRIEEVAQMTEKKDTVANAEDIVNASNGIWAKSDEVELRFAGLTKDCAERHDKLHKISEDVQASLNDHVHKLDSSADDMKSLRANHIVHKTSVDETLREMGARLESVEADILKEFCSVHAKFAHLDQATPIEHPAALPAVAEAQRDEERQQHRGGEEPQGPEQEVAAANEEPGGEPKEPKNQTSSNPPETIIPSNNPQKPRSPTQTQAQPQPQPQPKPPQQKSVEQAPSQRQVPTTAVKNPPVAFFPTTKLQSQRQPQSSPLPQKSPPNPLPSQSPQSTKALKRTRDTTNRNPHDSDREQDPDGSSQDTRPYKIRRRRRS